MDCTLEKIGRQRITGDQTRPVEGFSQRTASATSKVAHRESNEYLARGLVAPSSVAKYGSFLANIKLDNLRHAIFIGNARKNSQKITRIAYFFPRID